MRNFIFPSRTDDEMSEKFFFLFLMGGKKDEAGNLKSVKRFISLHFDVSIILHRKKKLIQYLTVMKHFSQKKN